MARINARRIGRASQSLLSPSTGQGGELRTLQLDTDLGLVGSGLTKHREQPERVTIR